MKTHDLNWCRLALLAIICFVTFASTASAQDDRINCGTIFDPNKAGGSASINLSQLGGIYLPASGSVRVLLVFVSFPEDNTVHPYWPAHQPPTEMNQYIDSTETQNSANFSNLTNYFRQMSLGSYKVVGKAVYVNAPHTKAWYDATYGFDNRGPVSRDVLQNAVDPIVNFTSYDNWTRDADYTFRNQPDTIVDMIVMVWRGFQWNLLGEASLGGAPDLIADGKTIKFGYPIGSGVFCSFRDVHWPDKLLQVMSHEIGHWLLGGAHPYSYSVGLYAPWAVLGLQFSAGTCMNTYERERLGWINPTIVDTVNCALADYITTGVAYKYHPPNGAANEYLYFENHQRISVYDDATVNSNDKGVWVIHQLEPYNGTDNIRIKPADGFYSWTNPATTSLCFSQTLPYFKKQAVNRTSAGRAARDQLPTSPSTTAWMSVYQDEYNALHCGAYNRGEATFGAFNLDYSKVFSRWSNPTANCWNDAVNDFGMELIAQNAGVVTVHFYTGSRAVASAPSKPQFLRASPNPGNHHVLLTWAANIEPDLLLYEVWRKDANTGNIWQSIGTSTTASYVDNDYYLPGYDFLVLYKVRAKDTQSIYSSFSDSIQARCEWLHKEILTADVKEFSFAQNYPNPFNPATQLVFTLPRAGMVKLVVYDVLGREVAMLMNENADAGFHVVTWNPTNFASGTYLARLAVKGPLGIDIFNEAVKLVYVR
jgi:M6 family metalloprotease-like protein